MLLWFMGLSKDHVANAAPHPSASLVTLQCEVDGFVLQPADCKPASDGSAPRFHLDDE